MWAMKTSCPTTQQNRSPSSTSCLSASSCTTPPNVWSLPLSKLQFRTGSISLLPNISDLISTVGIWKHFCSELIFLKSFCAFLCSPSVHTQRHPEGLAGEEPPLVGALWCPQRDNREYQGHCHPLLHGHEGKYQTSFLTLFPFVLNPVIVFFLVTS